jgi:AAA domain
VINPSLTEKLRRDANLDVPGDWVWEDKPIAQELDEVRDAVRGTGWTVRDDAVIGLFSFQKYVMYRDLLDHEEHVAKHPLVRSLAQGRLVPDVRDGDPDVPEPEELDEAQAPAETLSILDADASQRRCVEAAKRGRSFVMQGPPGTGKSQTIANVIAEAIGQGKRVLFVSEKAAALDVVFKRLAARGLDEYCLMLHGEHAGRREVVQALDHSLTTSLQPRPAMRSDEIERLVNLRIVLNDSAELLHLPQPLLGERTLREVHEQLAQLYAAPSVPGAPEPGDVAGAAVLDEFQSLSEVFQRLAERWYVSPPDYLWRGYKGDRFTADDHGRVVATVRGLRDAVRALIEQATSAAAEHGLPAPPSLRVAQRLADIGDHLEQAPALEPHWLDSEPSRLLDAVNSAETGYGALAAELSEFTQTFPARGIDDFPADMGARLQNARDEVQRICGWAAAWQEASSALPDGLRTLDDLPSLITALRDRADAVSRALGQPEGRLTRTRVDELAELAEFAFNAEHRPEREWLVRAGLERAELAHTELADDLATYQEQRAQILQHYGASALDLDAAAIGQRFAEQYTSLFSKLSGSYRQDAKAIKAARDDGKLPSTLAEDLRLIAAAREVGQRIDTKSGQTTQALGSYAAGRDTDPAAIASAVAVARRVLQLSAPDANLAVLAEKIAVGSAGDPELARAADQLRAAKYALVERLPLLQRFVATPDDLFKDGLDQLQVAVARVDPPVRGLAALIDELNTGAVGPVDSVGAAQERADTISALHRSRERVAAHNEIWKRAIGSPFAGGHTDWNAVRAAAKWLERMRAFGDNALTATIRRQLESGERAWPSMAAVGRACDRLRGAVEELAELFEPDRQRELDEQCSRSRSRRWRSCACDSPTVSMSCATGPNGAPGVNAPAVMAGTTSSPG